MLKKILSLLLIISMLLSTATVYAREKTLDIVLNTNYRRGSEYIESCAVSELQISPDKLHVSNITNVANVTDVVDDTNATLYTSDDFTFEEYAESSDDIIKGTDTNVEKTIPLGVTEVNNYIPLNVMYDEEDEEAYVISDEIIDGEIIPQSQPQTYSNRANTIALDSSLVMNHINSKDTFALKNQTGKTNYTGDNIGEEYIDPLTGNLIITETDLVLPGIDGLDLNLSRYYNLAEAEFYTKSVAIETNPEYNTFLLENGGFVVTETITDTETQQTSTYDYFYLSENQAEKRRVEIESRNTLNSPYTYKADKVRKGAGEYVTVDYYYTSEITSTSYSRKRNNLGVGWSWGFPSVEVIKDNYDDITEDAKAIYYHDGKGNTMEVEYNAPDGKYSFVNYIGGDITFEDYFNYDPDICSTGRIDYIVDNPDGTKYYFGIYGELLTIKDRYGNKITFTYFNDRDFYGAENSLLIETITDTVGRTVTFDYSEGGTHEDITVTVTSPIPSEGNISLTYEKRMINVKRADGSSVSTEPILETVTNAIGEVTTYYPAMKNGERKNAFPIQFTFADKSFNSEFVYNTSGYAYNLVYLLGNIVRPHSNTYYDYGLCERNLGHSGVSQAYRVVERGDFELVIDEDYNILEDHEKNVVNYKYIRDYTGYPLHNSIESIPNNGTTYVAKTKVATGDNTSSIATTKDFYKIDNAVLQRDAYVKYIYEGQNTLVVDSQSTFFQKMPSRTRIDYYIGDNCEYTSYTQVSHHSNPDKAYGKPELVTEEVDYDTIISDDREKHSVRYEYDTTTGLVESKSWYQKNNVKCTETYTYDENNDYRLLSIENAEGHIEQYDYTYDSQTRKVGKRTITTTNDLGKTVVEEIYTEETKFAFPSTVIKTVTANNVTTVETTSYEYNLLLGLITGKTDTDGNTTYYEYDNLGRPTRVIYPSYQSYTNYNEKGQKILPVEEFTYKTVLRDYGEISAPYQYLMAQEIYSALSYYDITTSTESDPRNIDLTNMPETFYSAEMNYYMGTGELIEKNATVLVENDGEIATTTYYYDTEKNTVTVVDAQGNTTTTHYDGLGREVKVVDRFGNYHITEYNLKGNGVGFKSQSYFVPHNDTTAKENILEVTYDRLSRVISEKAYSSYPESYIETKYTYDLAGNLIGIIDPNENLNQDGYTESYTYDKLNRVTKVKTANNEIIQNTYDNAGNIKTQTVNGQPLYNRHYDGVGKLVNDADNGNNSNQYAYDAQGRCILTQNKNGIISELEYNAGGFADGIQHIKNCQGIIDRRYGYVNPYSPSSVYDLYWEMDNSGVVTQGYFSSEQESGVTPSGAMAIKKTEYNLATGDEGAMYTSYSHYMYDNLGNVTSTLHGSTDEAGNVFGSDRFYSYDKGRLTEIQVGMKNTGLAPNIPIAEYDYYPDGKLKSVSYPPLSDGTVLKSEYNYDGLSRLSNLTNYKGTTVLSCYTYTYDKNGNITNISEEVEDIEDETDFTYDKLNRIESVSGTKGVDSYYEYDARGNRIVNYEQIDFLDEDSISYTYDEENKLSLAEFSDSYVSYYYDVDGYRCAKYGNDQVPEFYLYDEAGRLQAEIQVAYAGTQAIMYPVVEYIWGPDRVLAQIDIQNNIYYYLYNGHGDVVQIVDTSGVVKNTYDYDVWGNFLKKEETIENHFTYFGQTYDEETGLYYLRARYYDSTTGRFTQQDPAEDGYNWYIYGSQNPVKYIDSNGLDARAITAPSAANNFGHTSLLLEDEVTGEWSYYYYGPSKSGMPVWTAKVILQVVPELYKMSDGSILKPLESISDLNKWLVESGVHDAEGFNPYKNSVYIEGDFTKSIEHAKNDVKKNNGNFNWNDEIYLVIGGSCATESMEVLYKGDFKKYKGFLGSIQKLWDYPAISQAIPNSLHKSLKNIFSNARY